MNNLFWLIWDAASYEITQKLLIENELHNVKKLINNGVGCKMLLHEYNCQTPCALATQFTGYQPKAIEIGGYYTPNYLFKGAERLKYKLSFLNKNVATTVLWHEKHIGKKRVGLCQIPFSNSDVNDINNINGYAKKKHGFKIIYYNMLEWNFSGNDLITSFMLHERKYNIILKSNGRDVILKNSTGQKVIVECNSNQNNNVWLDDRSGFQFFAFDLNDDNKIMFLFSDVWEYSFEGFKPDKDFKDNVGVFMGIAYGRQYRNGEFGKNYYYDGDGTAERIYLNILEHVALCFKKMSEYMISKHRYDIIISYQPCIDEASHEFYGWWKNSEGEDKLFYWEILKKAYRFADAHLGVFLDHSDNNDNIVLTSDHGIYSVKYNFYINEYLHTIGLLSYNEDNMIDVNKSLVYFHPANTGAMFFRDGLSEEEKNDIKGLFRDIVIDGIATIRELKDTKGEMIFGDFFIIPEKDVNILAERNDCILTKTPKTGCHTVNNNESSMAAIFYAAGEYFQNDCDFEGLKNTDIKPMLIDIVSRKEWS